MTLVDLDSFQYLTELLLEEWFNCTNAFYRH